VTVSVAAAWFTAWTDAGRDAVMTVVPAESAWLEPVGDTVAIVVTDDAHVTLLVTSP